MAASRRRATLATVAASAGVSVATVSKVLNGRSDVAPATRSLVLSLLAQHDYVAPPQRRGEPAASDTVEVEFDDDLNPYSTEIVQGAVEAGAELDASIVVSIRRSADRTGGWARGLVAAGRRALVAVTGELTGGQLGALSRARLPLVVIDPLNLPRTRVTSVGSTNFAGGLAATQHLLGLGHRRVAHLGGPATAACTQARLHGYRAAMEAAGVSVPAGYVRTAHFHYQDGIEGGAALFDLPEPPTAIFAGCDEIAFGVLEAARARGLRVPEDVSVVGFDDTQIARMASPPLTTVRQPLREMGAVAVRTALRLAAGERIESHHVELATELVVRGSTAPVATMDTPAAAPEDTPADARRGRAYTA
ncbi:LacI family DNA-binding transcriptional regulator [Microbispora amethystogenes]|uniref:Transcriptional regulator n=1 Tax=Microbispora amethystogenes TaxID=1427754 RepID=A0ABQ4FFK0_9ACTN|nr:substrate-binding domain-containing protein [Microbispora amethystogenes]GIH33591.1 transcriptional regulator [Microbispora amethystogenes]